MRFNRYSSATDEGTEAVIQAIALQPETVLGFVFVSYDQMSGLGSYPLLEFADEYKEELSKYQVVVLLTHGYKDIFDTQATLFFPRYPLEYLTQLSSLVPQAAVLHVGAYGLPKGVSSITNFHDRTFAQDKEWVTSYKSGLRGYCENVISDGYRAKAGALELRSKYKVAGSAALMSKIDD